MRERVPDWVTQLARGIGAGKDWILGKLQKAPLLVRIGGWILFQAVLFKVQPHLWRGLVSIVEAISEVQSFAFRTQLLFVILGLLIGQTVTVILKLMSVEDVVKSMTDSAENPPEAIADGGTTVSWDDVDGGTSGIGGVGGAFAGAAFGSVFGPAGTIGFAVLGAMLGDEYEKRELKRRYAIIHGERPKE